MRTGRQGEDAGGGTETQKREALGSRAAPAAQNQLTLSSPPSPVQHAKAVGAEGTLQERSVHGAEVLSVGGELGHGATAAAVAAAVAVAAAAVIASTGRRGPVERSGVVLLEPLQHPLDLLELPGAPVAHPPHRGPDVGPGREGGRPPRVQGGQGGVRPCGGGGGGQRRRPPLLPRSRDPRTGASGRPR